MKSYCIRTLQNGGSRHRFCQDRYYTHRCADRLILAVCDGHGGRPYCRSGLGARFAAAAAVAVLESDIEAALIPAAIKDRYDAMVKKHLAHRPLTQREAERAGDMPHSGVYGTTVLAAVITDHGTDIYQLGDGEIRAVSKKGNFFPMLPADESCRGNLTSSLANGREFALRHFRHLHYASPIGALMLFSDGCEGGFLDTAHALTDPSRLEEGLQAMLHRTDHGDDQTFLLAYDPTAIAQESFQETLTQRIKAAREAIRRKNQIRREREEYARLAAYMNLALQKAERMRQAKDPTLQPFLTSLQPSYQRFLQLRKKTATTR